MTTRDEVEAEKARILHSLKEDGCARASHLARALGMAPRSVDRRLSELRQEHRVWSDRFGGYSIEQKPKVEKVVVGVHNLQLAADRVPLEVFRRPWFGAAWKEVPGGWCRQETFAGREVTFRVFSKTQSFHGQVGATKTPLGPWEFAALTGYLSAALPFINVEELVVPYLEVAVDLHGVRLSDYGYRFTAMKVKHVQGYVLQVYDKVIAGLPVLRQELQIRPQMLFSQVLREALLIAGEFGGGPLITGLYGPRAFDGSGYA